MLHGWVLNVLMTMFYQPAGDMTIYNLFKDAGAPCYVWIGDHAPDTPQPACYDPTNLNPGYIPKQLP